MYCYKKSTDVCYSYFCEKKVFIFKMMKSTDVCYDFFFLPIEKKKKIIAFYRIFLCITDYLWSKWSVCLYGSIKIYPKDKDQKVQEW